MTWQVCISNHGVEQQLCLGDKKTIAKKQEHFLRSFDRKRIKLVFNGYDSIIVASKYWYRGIGDEELEAMINKELEVIANKYGAYGYYASLQGYNIRKTTLPDYIEVFADLDADDYSEFGKKYSGLDGAIDILYNTTSVLHGAMSNPAKAVARMIKEIEFKKSEES